MAIVYDMHCFRKRNIIYCSWGLPSILRMQGCPWQQCMPEPGIIFIAGLLLIANAENVAEEVKFNFLVLEFSK